MEQKNKMECIYRKLVKTKLDVNQMKESLGFKDEILQTSQIYPYPLFWTAGAGAPWLQSLARALPIA